MDSNLIGSPVVDKEQEQLQQDRLAFDRAVADLVQNYMPKIKAQEVCFYLMNTLSYLVALNPDAKRREEISTQFDYMIHQHRSSIVGADAATKEIEDAFRTQ